MNRQTVRRTDRRGIPQTFESVSGSCFSSSPAESQRQWHSICSTNWHTNSHLTSHIHYRRGDSQVYFKCNKNCYNFRLAAENESEPEHFI